MVSSNHNPDLRNIYLRINEKKASKMVGVTALQRKILVLIYTLWKKNEVFDENYGTQRNIQAANNPEIIPTTNPKNEAGKSYNLPAQDELPPNRSKFSFV